jgi:aminobenzoyl-glutamate utilization protein B
MPCFSKEDWTPENATRLNLIVMTKMALDPFSSFKDLEESQKKKYNRILNQYIQSLGDKGVEQLKEEFDQLVMEDILTEKFKPELSKYYYDPTKYKTYLEQLGIKYPTLREDQKEELKKVKSEP